VTNREKLHHLVDELSEDEAAAAAARLRHERETVQRWAQAEDSSVEDTWADDAGGPVLRAGADAPVFWAPVFAGQALGSCESENQGGWREAG
jgi:hypothetical protein